MRSPTKTIAALYVPHLHVQSRWVDEFTEGYRKTQLFTIPVPTEVESVAVKK